MFVPATCRLKKHHPINSSITSLLLPVPTPTTHKKKKKLVGSERDKRDRHSTECDRPHNQSNRLHCSHHPRHKQFQEFDVKNKTQHATTVEISRKHSTCNTRPPTMPPLAPHTTSSKKHSKPHPSRKLGAEIFEDFRSVDLIRCVNSLEDTN